MRLNRSLMSPRPSPKIETPFAGGVSNKNTAMRISGPIQLLHDQLQDLFAMEIQLAASLPFLAEGAAHNGLQEQLGKQSQRGYRRKAQLLDIFRRLNFELGTDKCQAVEGIINGGDAHLATVQDPATRDLMLIAHSLRISLYVIAAYGVTARLASALAFPVEANLLSSLTFEEEDAVQRLKHLEPSLFEIAYRRDKVT